MKLYCCGFQIGLPDWPSIMAEGNGAIRPLRALSKSDVSSKGSACRNSAFAALVASVASLRQSCDWEAAGPEPKCVGKGQRMTIRRDPGGTSMINIKININ